MWTAKHSRFISLRKTTFYSYNAEIKMYRFTVNFYTILSTFNENSSTVIKQMLAASHYMKSNRIIKFEYLFMFTIYWYTIYIYTQKSNECQCYIIAPAETELQNKSALESNSKHMTAGQRSWRRWRALTGTERGVQSAGGWAAA